MSHEPPVADTPSHHSSYLKLAFLLLGSLLGVLTILGIRFATYAPETTHYHANFAVYINGQREDFKSPQYYEEIKICDLNSSTPQSRTHMHNQEAGVVHVHDKAVTWGAFFDNLGWVLGPDFIRTNDTLYTTIGEARLNIVLNGDDLTDITTISNQVIGDRDRLLISYGPSDSTVLAKQYRSVAADATRYNGSKDPGQCGGSGVPTFHDRLVHLF